MHKVKMFRIVALIAIIMATLLGGLKGFATEYIIFRGGGYVPKTVSASQQKQSAFIAALVDALGSYAELFGDINFIIDKPKSGDSLTRTKYKFQNGIELYRETRSESGVCKDVARLRIPATLLDRKDDLTILVKDFRLDSPSIDKIPTDTLISLLKRDLALVIDDVEITHAQDGGVSIELKLKKGQKIHTGLIIDAYGLDVRWCLVNRILSVTGKGETEEILGYKTIDEVEGICGSKIAYERMFVVFESSIERAIKNYYHVGSNPLIIKAVAADKCDIFISKDDAIKVKAANTRSKFLEKGKVIIVVKKLLAR